MHAQTALAALSFFIISLTTSQATHAQNAIGRYQMVTLPTKPGSFDSKVMILDTSEGDLWQWWETPAIGSSVRSSGITYLGKVAPGATAGIASPTRRSPMEPLMPKH